MINKNNNYFMPGGKISRQAYVLSFLFIQIPLQYLYFIFDHNMLRFKLLSQPNTLINVLYYSTFIMPFILAYLFFQLNFKRMRDIVGKEPSFKDKAFSVLQVGIPILNIWFIGQMIFLKSLSENDS